MQIADNINDFVKKIIEAERETMNTPYGQEITKKLFKLKLATNPDITKEEWQQLKSEFLIFLFVMFGRETPEVMKELGKHIWNELRQEE